MHRCPLHVAPCHPCSLHAREHVWDNKGLPHNIVFRVWGFRATPGPLDFTRVISKALILRIEEFTVFEGSLFGPRSFREGQVALHV